MSKPPKKIIVGGIPYRVHNDQASIDRGSVELHGDLGGFSSASRQLIALQPDLAPDYTATTLVHEILHLCLRASSCDPDADAKAGLDDVEERAVSAIAAPLLATLRDNPKFIRFLLGDASAH